MTAGSGAGERKGGEREPPAESGEMRDAERRLGPPVTSQGDGGRISAAQFVSLTYTLSLSVCSLEACFAEGESRGVACSDLEDVTLMRLFCCEARWCDANLGASAASN